MTWEKKFKSYPRGEKTDKRQPNINHLSRIILFLSENPDSNQSTIAKAINLENSLCKKSILWLSSHNLITISRSNSAIRLYKLTSQTTKDDKNNNKNNK